MWKGQMDVWVKRLAGMRMSAGAEVGVGAGVGVGTGWEVALDAEAAIEVAPEVGAEAEIGRPAGTEVVAEVQWETGTYSRKWTPSASDWHPAP